MSSGTIGKTGNLLATTGGSISSKDHENVGGTEKVQIPQNFDVRQWGGGIAPKYLPSSLDPSARFGGVRSDWRRQVQTCAEAQGGPAGIAT